MPELKSLPFHDLLYVHDVLSRHGVCKNLEISSPFILTKELEQTGYLAHFPWQVLETQDTTIAARPAACLGVYRDAVIGKSNKTYERSVLSPVYRTEAQTETHSAHFNGFWMLEYVYIGSPEYVQTKASQLRNKIPAIWEDFGIKVSPVITTDAFFLEESEGSKLIQKMKKLKTEYQEVGTGFSLASLNLHESYFTTRFNMNEENKTFHSLCLAFGIDRIISAKKRHHER